GRRSVPTSTSNKLIRAAAEGKRCVLANREGRLGALFGTVGELAEYLMHIDPHVPVVVNDAMGFSPPLARIAASRLRGGADDSPAFTLDDDQPLCLVFGDVPDEYVQHPSWLPRNRSGRSR